MKKTKEEKKDGARIFAFGGMAVMAIILVMGASACTSSSTNKANMANSAPTATPANVTASASPMASISGAVPTSLANAGEYGENIYDYVKANDWAKAGTKLASLKDAAKQIRTAVTNASAGEDKLDANIAALDKAVAAKDRQAAMREANQVTLDVADMTAPFKLPVPIEVTRLDYQGRELDVWAAAKDAGKLKSTADEMQQTWNALRPQIESHNGAAEAKKFGDLVARVEAAKTPDEYARLAKPVLDEVDNLEKVFKK